MFHGENCCDEESFVSQLGNDDNGEGGEKSVNKVVIRDGGAGFCQTLSGGEGLRVCKYLSRNGDRNECILRRGPAG